MSESKYSIFFWLGEGEIFNTFFLKYTAKIACYLFLYNANRHLKCFMFQFLEFSCNLLIIIISKFLYFFEFVKFLRYTKIKDEKQSLVTLNA